jgi:hypothetical protein
MNRPRDTQLSAQAPRPHFPRWPATGIQPPETSYGDSNLAFIKLKQHGANTDEWVNTNLIERFRSVGDKGGSFVWFSGAETVQAYKQSPAEIADAISKAK